MDRRPGEQQARLYLDDHLIADLGETQLGGENQVDGVVQNLHTGRWAGREGGGEERERENKGEWAKPAKG